MRKLPIIILLSMLACGYASADDCETVLQSVRTMRDARDYFRCIADQIRRQNDEQTPAALPAGIVYAWDPVIRDGNGDPTGGYRAVPYGWTLCNGEHGTPDLTGRFLMGADSIIAGGHTGGRAIIGESGEHDHSGTTGITKGPDHSIGCSGKCNGGRTAAHSHSIDLVESGRHSHGTNLPPYYEIVFICKTDT
jgi:hypothetical protein